MLASGEVQSFLALKFGHIDFRREKSELGRTEVKGVALPEKVRTVWPLGSSVICMSQGRRRLLS